MYQVIKQTDEEKMVMYMKLPKKELIKMLIQANKIIDSKPITYSIIDSPQCYHYFVQSDPYWKKCNHCGMIEPLSFSY